MKQQRAAAFATRSVKVESALQFYDFADEAQIWSDTLRGIPRNSCLWRWTVANAEMQSALANMTGWASR